MVDTAAFSNSNVSQIGNSQRNNVQIQRPDHGWGEEITNRLNELMNLHSGWDGYNAKPVSLENASFAINILREICDSDTQEPQIVPGVNGDLQIEWHTHAGDIELHIVRPYEVLFWTSDTDICKDDEEITLSTNFTQVMRTLRKHTSELAEQQNDAAASAR